MRNDLDSSLTGLKLWPHHLDTIRRTIAHFEAVDGVEALLLGGSLAHGFATAESDVDIVIVVTDDEFRRRLAVPDIGFWSDELSTWEGGYVDGKFVSRAFLAEIAARGDDATRWGYQDARILFSRDDGLADTIAGIVAFPEAEADERLTRFAAQLLAWQWYHGQGWDKQDPYLRGISLNRVVLFACRIVLTANRMLFPFHKWLRRVTADAPHRPAGLMDDIAALYDDPTRDRVDALIADVLAFYDFDVPELQRTWGAVFMRDTEWSWLAGPPAVDDL